MRKRRPPARRPTTINRELTIDALSRRGEGLAHGIAVPFALPGERVEARVAGKTALVTSRHTASALRHDPLCPHFGLPGDGCGGCTLQHLGGKAALKLKKDRLLTAMRRVFPDAELHSSHTSSAQSRRRALFSVRPDAAGFRTLHGSRIVHLKSCAILHPEIFAVVGPLRRLSAAIGQHFSAHVTLTDTGLDIDLGGIEDPALGVTGLERLAEFCEVHDLARLSVNGVPLAERRAPMVTMGGVPVAVPPSVFLQPTEEGAAALTDEVLTGIAAAGTVADLFCGVGTFALPLSSRHEVLAIDAAGPAVRALEQAAKLAGRPVKAVERDLSARPLSVSELRRVDAVVLDPPRSGAPAQAPLIAEAGVGLVVAVSCHPESLARDAASFAAAYDLSRLVMVDQFGWSAHLEAVAVFRKR